MLGMGRAERIAEAEAIEKRLRDGGFTESADVAAKAIEAMKS